MKRSRAADFFDVESDNENESDSGNERDTRKLGKDVEDDEEELSDDEDEQGRTGIQGEEDEDGSDDDDEDVDEDDDKDEDGNDKIIQPPRKKVKKLTLEEAEEKEKLIRKTGVVYISRIPPFMKPDKMRHILSRFGQVNRIFLAPEDAAIRARRIKYGGNKKKNYTEGWAEMAKKKDAKIAAEALNGNPIGGKKGNYYFDDILNVKYLHKFKWQDLTEQITREQHSRQDRLRAEISRATAENKAFVQNVEKSKMIKKIQEKKGTADDEVRRTWQQRKTATTRSDTSKKPQTDGKVSNVLSKIF